MAHNSRSAIPGRAPPSSQDLDRLVFGPRDDGGEDVSEDIGDREFTERAARERRRVARRKTDYSPLPDGGGSYRAPEESKRGLIILALAVAVVGVFGAVVWNAYSQGVRPADGAATPELAASGPFKSRPAGAADGSEPEIEASVFERVESGAVAAPAVERVAEEAAPTPEVRPEIKPETTPLSQAGGPPIDLKPKSADSVVAAPAVAKVQPAAPKPAPAPVQTAAPAPVIAEPKAAPVVLAGGYTPAFSAGGGYAVQLAAPSTETAALAEWEKKKKAMPDLFGPAERFVVRADVNGKTVYRLRAGSFATAADADAFCGAIKTKGGDCFRTAK